jgi:hypothetical protein
MKKMTWSTLSMALLAANAAAQDASTRDASTQNASSQDAASPAQTEPLATPAVTLEPSGDVGHDGRRFGAGLMLGEPTGASLKYWLAEQSALDAGIGWSFHDDDDFHLHVDYLHHLFDLIPVDRGSLPVYFGGGVRAKFRDHRDDLFGFRAVAGLNYIFEDQPIDIFLEGGPVFDVAPDFDVRFTAAIGARYWF